MNSYAEAPLDDPDSTLTRGQNWVNHHNLNSPLAREQLQYTQKKKKERPVQDPLTRRALNAAEVALIRRLDVADLKESVHKALGKTPRDILQSNS